MPNEGTLKRRFTFKLASNLWAVALALVTMSFVSRSLGPENFGRFEFISSNFKLVLDTLTMQVPVAYFNWVSRKGHKEDINVASGITLYFSLAMTAIFAVFISLTLPSGLHKILWPGIEPIFLWESLLFTLVVFSYQLLVYLSDGISMTVGLEKIRLLQNTLKAVFLLLVIYFGAMNLHAYFLVQTMVIALTVGLSIQWLSSHGAISRSILHLSSYPKDERNRFTDFAFHYARPLTILMFSGFVFLYFDRWFLQLIGGSVQQGYFGLSDRLGAIAFIFTSAMTPLLTREFAFAHEEHDRERLVQLFGRIRIFLFIAIVTSCFLSVQSNSVVKLMGGDNFQRAALPIAIMTMYPIHQTFGQLSGALLIATGQTTLYSRIGIVAMLLSLPITYLLIAPASYYLPGLALGATGLALKMVLMQFVATNVQLYCNTRYLDISYRKWLWYQISVIPMVYALAYTVSQFTSGFFRSILPDRINELLISSMDFILSGMVYSAMVVLIVLVIPKIAGLSREDVRFRQSVLSGR